MKKETEGGFLHFTEEEEGEEEEEWRMSFFVLFVCFNFWRVKDANKKKNNKKKIIFKGSMK